MANGKVHTLSIIVPYILICILLQVDILGEYTLLMLIALLGTKTPDLLEPARHYKHRKFFHSKKFAKVLFIILGVSVLLSLFRVDGAILLACFTGGYLIHLALDAATPMGLPEK